jgi:hypothetical protein
MYSRRGISNGGERERLEARARARARDARFDANSILHDEANLFNHTGPALTSDEVRLLQPPLVRAIAHRLPPASPRDYFRLDVPFRRALDGL